MINFRVKLSPCRQHGFLRSEENVNYNNLFRCRSEMANVIAASKIMFDRFCAKEVPNII